MRQATRGLALLTGVIALFVTCTLTFCTIGGNVENLGIFGESRKESILGQDGCTPISLNGTMMWTFGDTILGSWKGDLTVSSTFEDTATMKGMISNALAFTPVPDETTIRKLPFTFHKERGAVAPFIRNRHGEDPRLWRFWAIDGILIDSVVYVYYIAVYIDPNQNKKSDSLLPIRVMGVGLAEWRKPETWKPGEAVNFRRTVMLFKEGEPVFGDSITRRGDYLYLLGHGPASGNRVPAYIARVHLSGIKIRAEYEFLGKMGEWSGSIAGAMPFFNDVMGEPSLSYNEFLKRYVIIYCGLDGSIRMTVFKEFYELEKTTPVIIYIPPSLPKIESRTHLFYYSGKEIFHSDRAIYAIYINPAIYQPMLLRIPYRGIGSLRDLQIDEGCLGDR